MCRVTAADSNLLKHVSGRKGFNSTIARREIGSADYIECHRVLQDNE